MFFALADSAAGHIGADVCVVGAGPAGLAVAAELSRAGIDVVVLEAGGPAYDRHSRSNAPKIMRDHLRGAQVLTRGRNRGEPYYPLRLSRARGLGGSTNALLSHGLRARPLDAIDFESRPGADGFGVGWPIAYEEVDPYLDDAARFVGFDPADSWPLQWTPQPPVLGSYRWSRITAAPVRHAPRLAIPELGTAMATGPQPRLITSAVVTSLGSVVSSRVRAIEARLLGGGLLRVEADVFVIASGGIDNARLLLAARPVLYSMGEAADQVGRYFMEHPHYLAGYLVPSSDVYLRELLDLFGEPSGSSQWLTAGDDVVRSEGLLRAAVFGVPVTPASLHPAVPAAGELARLLPFGPYGLRQRVKQSARVLRGGRQVASAIASRIRREARTVLALAVMGEQLPNPASRVALGSRVDRTGLPLPELYWRVDDREFASVRRTIELIGEEVERSGVGTVVSLWDEGRTRPDVVTGGWHHMGTTRMSADPADGAVDANCRVHGIENLFVAGSSVFATSGYANPTLTLVALAVRLGRHLAAGRR